MKRIVILLILSISFSFIYAQNSKVVSAYNYMKPQYNELDKAKENIDAAAKHEKTIGKAKTWYYRGQIYHSIYQSKDEKFKSLDPDPLKVAVESYEKAMELDTKNQYKIDIISRLTTASLQFMNDGIDAFNNGEYKKSYEDFVNSLAINELPEFNKTDTVVMFNAAIAADRAHMYDLAYKMYKKVSELNYGGSGVYSYMANILKNQGDTVKFLATLKDGIAAFPEDNNALMVELINFYLSTGKSKEALEYLKIAIENDPENQTYYFAQGTLYDQLKETDNAIVSYKKAIELKPDYFDALLNLGAIYYNMAGDIIKAANDNLKLTNKQYEAEKQKAYDQFKVALPYLEKAHEIKPEHIETMISLKEMYYRLQMMDKYKEMKDLIEAAKNKTVKSE
ncbi:MAG: tetratricopeptide repeat protein [Chlorobi bacterium]|nr:tetratricopeptide repeat protein [Chlorobiota bacterium]